MKCFTRGSGGVWLILLVCAVLFPGASLSLRTEVNPPDTDGDGLSDADEVNLHHTNPRNSDTDGDGMSDGAEVLAGTNPLDQASVFKVLGPPERIPGGWRLRWSSVAGKTYRLVQIGRDQLGSNWSTLAEIPATGATASFDDTNAPLAGRYYRVWLGAGVIAGYFQGDPDRFVPLNAQGQPVEGGLIPLNPDGSLAPFEFRPAGRSLAGARAGLFVRFPNGARVVTNGLAQIQFTTGYAGLGLDGPFQLKTALALTNGAQRTLPVGTLDFAGLKALFGVPAATPLEAVLWGQYTLSIVKGIFEDTGTLALEARAPSELRLTDDLVLFEARFGFTVESQIQSGQLRLGGSAGVFARHTLPAPGQPIGPADFYLFASDLGAAAALIVPGNRTDLNLTNGTVRLPEYFYPTNVVGASCTNTPPSGGGGPSVAITPQQPILLSVSEGNPPRLSCSGGLEFYRFGFAVPDLPELAAGVCQATLQFNGEQLPYLTNLNGWLSIPLPPGQTTRVDVLNAAASLEGLPTGTLRLGSDLTLFQAQDQLTVKLLGAGNTCNAQGSSLTVLKAPLDGLPTLKLEGTIQVDLPPSVISGRVGQVVRATACGSLAYNPPSSFVFALEGFAIGAMGGENTYRLAGQDELLLENPTVSFDNLETLFNPASEKLLVMHLGGTLRLPEGKSVVLQSGSVAFAWQEGKPVPQRLSGSGEFHWDQSLFFSAALDLDFTTQTLNLDGSTHNLNLRLTDDLVIFDAGLGLTVSATQPAGEVRASGSVGLFARGMLSDPLTPSQFFLSVSNAQVALDYRADGLDTKLSNGVLRLPEWFYPTNLSSDACAQGPAGTGGPSVALDPAHPIVISVTDGDPPRTSLSGDLAFYRFGFAVPDLPELAAGVCQATLKFNGEQLPYITNLNGWLSIPLPPGQTTRVDVLNAAASLDGFPTGTLRLGTDVTLYNTDTTGDLAVRMLGASNSCNAQGSSLTVLKAPLNEPPTLKFEGTIQVDLPLSVITGSQGEVVRATACGAVTYTPPKAVHFEPGAFKLETASVRPADAEAAQFLLGGLRQVGVVDPSVSFENLDALFDPNSGKNLVIHLGGTLGLPGGKTFKVTTADFVFAWENGLPVPQHLSGSGEFHWDQSLYFTAALALDTPTRTLSLDGSAHNLNLRLTDNFVLFDAGLGLTVSAAKPEGEIRASGSVGLFARGTLTEPLTQNQFQLAVSNAQVALDYRADGFDTRLSNGVLRLPDWFYPTNLPPELCTEGSPGGGPSVALDPAHPIVISVTEGDPPTLRCSGDIDFSRLGFAVPGVPNMAAAVCHARLSFPEGGLPYLTNVSAALQIPIPNQTNFVDVTDGVFTLEGLPSGRVSLRKDLTLIDAGGFQFVLLGAGHSNCPPSGLTVYPSQGLELPSFKLDGGVKVQAPASVLTGADGDVAYGMACGSLSVKKDALPELVIQTLQFGGTFHLGGAEGLLLKDATISLENIQNAFDPKPDAPFIVRVGGRLVIPDGPEFELKNGQFIFFDRQRLPRLQVDGLAFDATNPDFELVRNLPAAVDAASLTFLNPGLELPYLLAPTNITLTMSAHVRIPPTDNPVVAGRVDNIKVTFGNLGLPKIESIAGLGLEIGSLNIPPIEEIGGKLYIGGLTDPDGNPTPEKIYFAGKVAGSYNGYKLRLLLAFNLTGPIGMCMDVNAGSVGIPLGQSTFLLTGASGGVSFANNGKDPCDFTSYINTNGQPISTFGQLPAVVSWSNFVATVERMKATAEAYAPAPGEVIPAGAGQGEIPAMANEFDCPGGCPPATVNIFCQPHPNQAKFPNKIIAKFSSIDERTLNEVLQITPENLSALGGAPVEIATSLAHKVRDFVESRTPPLIVTNLPADKVAMITQAAQLTMDAMEQVFIETIEPIVRTNAANMLYAAIRDTLYAGAPCPDITYKVTATFSQQFVSSFLSGTVGAVLSTSGNAGIMGQVNLLGMPVGQLKGFVAGTDDKGLPNPAVCGELKFVFGPLDLGIVRAQMDCRDCLTGVAREFFKLGECLGEPIVRQLAAKAAPLLSERNLPMDQLLGLMSEVEKIGFMAELYQLGPEILANLPAGHLEDCFIRQFSAAWSAMQPYMVLCGKSSPKLFGIPLGGDLMEISAEVSKTNMAGVTSFSPSFLFMLAMDPRYAVLLRGLFPIDDRAVLGYNVAFPDPGQAVLAGMSGKLSSPQALARYAAETFDYSLQHSVYTMQFELKPIGGKGLDSQARIVLPNFTNHPAQPGSTWSLTNFAYRGLLSREDLLLTLESSNLLAATFWTGEDLGEIDPKLAGYSLRKDYFPHGGFMGASRVMFPRALTDTPPDYLPGLLNPASDMAPLDRALNALDYVQKYLLDFRDCGTLAFYVPAPNPPYFTNANGNLGPRELLEAISQFDLGAVTNAGMLSLYPFDVAFIKGYFNTTLLGVPMATGIVVALPPSPADGRSEAIFRVEVAATPQGWLSYFVQTNNLIFDLHGAPPRPIEAWANDVYHDLAALALDPGAGEAELQATALAFVESLQTNLPKMRMEADLQFSMPDPIRDILAMNGTARLHAYSPKYEPGYDPTNTAPMARIRREGGIAFSGNAKLKAGLLELEFVNIQDAEFSLVPREGDLPEIAAHLLAPVIPYPPDYPLITFRDVVLDLATAPQPRFYGAGRLELFSIGNFQFAPVPGSVFGGSLAVTSQGGGQAAVQLSINPAVLVLDAYGAQLLVHGATRDDPFSFSTSGPWTASLELTNRLNLLNVVEVGADGCLSPLTLNANGLSSGSFTAGLAPGAGLTLFPARSAWRQDITLAAGVSGSLTMGSDKRFLLTAQLGGSSLSFDGNSVPAGATLVASNEGVAFTWQIAGAASGALGLGTNGTVDFSGRAELPPLDLGVFRLSGAGGGNLAGGFDRDGFAVSSGAELRLNADWLGRQVLTLSSFTLSNNGAISVAATNASSGLVIADYPFEPTALTFTRTPTNQSGGGVATLALSARLKAQPNFLGLPPLVLTGQVSSAGAVFLQNSASEVNFYGFPVANFTNTFSLAAGDYRGRLKTELRLGNGQGLWSALGTNWFTGEFSPNGAFQLQSRLPNVKLLNFSLTHGLFEFGLTQPGQPPVVRLEGDAALDGFPMIRFQGGIDSNGGIYLTPAPPAPAVPVPYPQFNGDVSLVLDNTGLHASGGLQLAPLPRLNLSGDINADGSFRFSGPITDQYVADYRFTNALITLTRRVGGTAYVSANGQLVLPGLGAFGTSGGFTNDGTYGLRVVLSGNTGLSGLPVTNIANATLLWTHNGVSLAGGLTGGVLSQVLPAPGFNATGLVSIASSGALTLSGLLEVQPLTNGLFTIRPESGDRFVASFDNAGLSLPPGAVLRYGTLFSAPLPLPAITILANGDFSAAVGSPNPVSLELLGFGLQNVTFALRRTGGVLGLDSFEGELNLPGLNTLAYVVGGLTNNGKFTLTGSIGSGLALSGLPITSLGAGASVTLDQDGLRVRGNVGGRIFSTVSQAGATGTLFVGADGTLRLGGDLTLPALQLGAFSISGAGGKDISLLLTNVGLVFKSGLQLAFDQTVFPDFTLPRFTNDVNWNFSFALNNVTLGLAGFTNQNASFSFTRTGNQAVLNVNSGALIVPGFKTPLTPQMTGSLSSSGDFQLAATASIPSPFVLLLPNSFGLLSNVTSVVLDNSGLRVQGDLQGGALASLNTGVKVQGTLTITPDGQITPAATIVLPELLLADKKTGFHLAAVGGGAFTLSLGPNGVTFPAGAQLFYQDQPLGTFSLPSFTIARTGNFGVDFGPFDLTLQGFHFNAGCTLGRTNGITMLYVKSGANLDLPGLNASLQVSGTVTNNGAFRLAGSTSSALGLPNFPVTSLGNASAEFASAGGPASLKLTGTLSGGVLSGAGINDIRLVNATATLLLSPAGAPVFSGSLLVRSFAVGIISVETNHASINGGPIAATIDNTYLRLSGARLKVSPPGFPVLTFALPPLNIPISGEFDLPVTLPSSTLFGIKGFNFNNVAFTLRRDSPKYSALRELRIQSFDGILGLAGFNQRFVGGIFNWDGTPDFNWAGGLSLGGFSAANGKLRLDGNGLSASGSFNLSAANHTFNSAFGFSGAINTDATFGLTGSGTLSLKDLEVGYASFTLTSSGVSGAPSLGFGDGSDKLYFSPGNFKLTSSGVSFSSSISWNRSLSIANSVDLASLGIHADLNCNSGDGSFEVRLGGKITVVSVETSFDKTLNANLEFTAHFPEGVWHDADFWHPLGWWDPVTGPCVDFDLAPLRAKACGTNW